MKVWDIAIRDMTRNFRSYFAVAFMFGVPILLTAIFYLAFGGIRNEDEGFSLPQTSIQVVNLDQPGDAISAYLKNSMPAFAETEEDNIEKISSLGDLMVSILNSEDLAQVVDITIAQDIDSARSAVDRQEAGVAMVIPEDFSEKIFSMSGQAVLTLYKDPTLSLGPSIVEGILQRFIDGFASTQITIQVVQESLAQAGLSLDESQLQTIVLESVNMGAGGEPDPGLSSVSVLQPSGAQNTAGEEQFRLMIGNIMGGMMIFYAFFTGASTIQNIIVEEEKGTLQRLFTTPTTTSMVLGGKFLAGAMTIIVQILTLLLFSHFVFGIRWGNPWLVVLYSITTTLSAVAFGIFLISFLKTTRQAGVIMGAVLPLTGMIGLLKVFMMGVSSGGQFRDYISLLTPQGWSIRALMETMQGGEPGIVIVSSGVMLIWAIVFFIIGIVRFNRRFA